MWVSKPGIVNVLDSWGMTFFLVHHWFITSDGDSSRRANGITIITHKKYNHGCWKLTLSKRPAVVSLIMMTYFFQNIHILDHIIAVYLLLLLIIKKHVNYVVHHPYDYIYHFKNIFTNKTNSLLITHAHMNTRIKTLLPRKAHWKWSLQLSRMFIILWKREKVKFFEKQFLLQ